MFYNIFFYTHCTCIHYIVFLQIGIIGGSGVDVPSIMEEREEKFVDTPFGKVQGQLSEPFPFEIENPMIL